MTGMAARAAFLGRAFLCPDRVVLCDVAAELDLTEFRRLLEQHPADLEIEYHRLFFNPGGTPCLLWQSAYSDEPHLMGEAHLSALEWYRRYGVEPSAVNDPADHAGLLLLFYARLLDSEPDPRIIEQFRHEHMDWLPALCDSIERESAHPFYLAVARMTRELTPVADQAESAITR